MLKNAIAWLRRSHRLHHLLGGLLLALALGFPAAYAAAAALEFKDWQWGGEPSVVDFILTVAGGVVGAVVRTLLSPVP